MAESATLETSVPEQSTDVLLLVENSQAMSYIWDDLRDRHLKQLMDKLLPASQATSHVWVLESQPSQASSTTQPRQYHDSRHALSEVFLNYMPENRISSSTVGFAAQFLAGLANPGGTQCSLHLIIVAVSTLVDDGDAGLTSEMNVASQHSTWSQLAEKLAQTSIYCHTLTTRAKEDMSALTTLFNETLRLGCAAEDLDSFPADSEVALRCSTYPAALNTLPSYGQPNQPPRPVRIAMPPRRNTFPQDSGYAEQIVEESQPQTSSEMDPPPSLVSQLQQVHGLTKKKVYGAKPQRRPFFKDERVERQERNFSLPAAVAMVPVPPPYLPDTMIQQHAGISASGGRVMSLSKADRHARLQAGPIDMQGRRSLAWSGRNSRIASPELLDPTGSPASLGGFSDVSPTASYISSDVSSPITPGSSEDYYCVHLQTAPAPSGFCGPPGIVEGGTSDPTWLQTSYAQGYLTSTGQAMAPIAHGYYIPTAPGASPPYYDTSLVGHGVDVYANTGAVVTHEVPPAVVLVAAPSEVLEKPPANPVPLEAVPPPVVVAPPAPVEAPVIQPSPPLPAAPTSTKKAKRRQEAVDDKDYIILDQQFADYGASINEEFANMLKEKDAEKIRELRASGAEELGNSSQPVLNASAVTYTASTDVPQGYLPGRGGDLAAGSSSRAVLPQTSPRSNSSVSSMPTPSSLASSTQHAIAAKPSSMLPLPPLATSSTASSAPTNEKALYNHPSTSFGFSGPYSASCYPLPAGFAPPSQQMVEPRFLPAIPSCVTVPTGVYQPYRQPAVYSQPTATTNLTSNSLTGWAG